MRFVHVAAVATIVFTLTGARARAETPLSPEARREAAERFDRGLKLFNQGENAGALVEFKRTYELTGDPTTLFNIGLVYAELKRPIEAVDALDTLLKSGAKLAPEQRQKAERVRGEQAAFISFLTVEANIPGAIEIDGVEAGHTPLTTSLRLAAGHHVVGVVAAGYAPSRKTIDIAGGETQKLAFTLVPGEAALGHLAVHCALPEATVWVDGADSGRTPLSQTLALNPGPHHIEVRRDGYRTAMADIKLDLGAVADLTLEPEIDAAAVAQTGGNLTITVSETDAKVSIDGHPAEALTGSVRLPVGPHHVSITRTGFEPADLDVTIARGATFNTSVNLQPDAQTRDAYLAGIHNRRVWGWSVAGVGVAALAAGAVVLITGHNDLDSANANYNTVYMQFMRGSGLQCDPSRQIDVAACNALLANANQRINDANTKMTIGYIVGGVGAAVAITGGILLLTNDDPDRYERKTASSSQRPTLMGWAGGGGGGLVLLGRF
jgi:hypothetical protein